MSKEYPCPMSLTGWCKYGGNKLYNYGFVRGMSSYCRKKKKWTCDLEKCPKEITDQSPEGEIGQNA